MLVFATVAIALAYEKTPASGTRYVVSANKKPVNIRKDPGTNYQFTALGQVPYGAKVTLHSKSTDKKGNTWYYVDYNGKYGWMMGSYLKTNKPHTHSYNKVISDITKPSGVRVVILECACGDRITRTYNNNLITQ